MEDVKDKSIHHTAIKICEDLQSSPAYKCLYEEVQASFSYLEFTNNTISGQ